MAKVRLRGTSGPPEPIEVELMITGTSKLPEQIITEPFIADPVGDVAAAL